MLHLWHKARFDVRGGDCAEASAEVLLRAVVFQRDGRWIAQVLEYDLAAHGRDLESLLAELRRVVEVHMAASREMGVEPFSRLPRAPERFWRMFDDGAPVATEVGHPPELPGFDVHAAVLNLPSSLTAAHQR